VAGARAQVHQRAAQRFLVEMADVRDRHVLFDVDQFGQAFGEVARRQDEIGDAGRDGASRHRGVFGLVGILHQDDAAGFLDRAHADRAVRTGAAQDDGETVAELFRE
jgi:hypothetical protein